MPDTIVRAPVARDYKEPGEFISAWRKFTLGEPIPAPTAEGATGGVAELGKLIREAATKFMSQQVRAENEHFWQNVPATIRTVDAMFEHVRNDGGYLVNVVSEFIAQDVRENLMVPVRSALNRICKRSTHFSGLGFSFAPPANYNVRRSPELWGPLQFGRDCQFNVMASIRLEFVPPRCVNRRDIALGAPRDLVRWIQQFPDLQTALAWIATDVNRAYRHHRYRGLRRDEYVPGSDPGFWVPDAGKRPARALVHSLTPFQRTNP